ncbi:hypothetical protein GS506_05185 [Rhodococcus hoagii]|nr:hypothetical protein [Prescottella equi]
MSDPARRVRAAPDGRGASGVDLSERRVRNPPPSRPAPRSVEHGPAGSFLPPLEKDSRMSARLKTRPSSSPADRVHRASGSRWLAGSPPREGAAVVIGSRRKDVV